MADLSPAKWRVLNALFEFSMHIVRPRLTEIHKTQDAGYDDLDDLFESRLIDVQIEGTDLTAEVGLHRVGNAARRHMRLRLTRRGLTLVLGNPGNHIRFTLGQHSRPIRLAKLFDGNTITSDDVIGQQRAGLISMTLAEAGEIESPTAAELAQRSVATHMHVDYLCGDLAKVALTAKGRDHLPR